MVDGVGMALVEIARIERVLEGRRGWFRHWFAEEELQRAFRRVRAAEELSGRFACKLAVRQALQRRIPPGARIALSEIVTSNDALGKPLVTLTGSTARWASDGSDSEACLHVSITHTRDTAAAIAVLSSARGPSGIMDEHPDSLAEPQGMDQ